MKIYLVGGAVRDELLGKECNDKDYVVVGSTHQEMLSKGFTQVGTNFPVYLHPETNEEYALARTERKVSEGHKGFETFFSPDVTLEEDLSRRDLTINAMAKDLETGEIIDPFGGKIDLKNKILKHTSEAFSDDPLRVFRLCRFKSQLGSDWKIQSETFKLALDLRSQLNQISAERKWKEMEKALKSDNFEDYVFHLTYLSQLPEVRSMIGVEQPYEHHPEGDGYQHTLLCLEVADKAKLSPQVKFAVLCHDFGKAVTYLERGNLHGHEAAGVPVVEQFCSRYRVPTEYKRLALKVTEFHGKIHGVMGREKQKAFKPKSIMKLFEDLGVVGKLHEKFLEDLLLACKTDSQGRTGKESAEYPQEKYLKNLWESMVAFETSPLATKLKEEGKDGVSIGEAIRVARIGEIRKAMLKEIV